METTFWTVFSGTLIIAFGNIINSLCVQPHIAYKKVIGEITYQLIFYAQAYSSQNIKKELHEEASDVFRKSASRIQVYYNSIEWMRLYFIPARKGIDKATSSLIGLSNNIPPRNDGGGAKRQKS